MAEPSVTERVRQLIEPPLATAGLEVVDVSFERSRLRVTVDRDGGVDLDAVSDASHLVSEILDRHDTVSGSYALEVSSPGVERPLRAPEHYKRFVGSDVVGRTRAEAEGERRFDGRLESADDHGVVVAGRRLAYGDIERCRTRFTWPPPSAGKRAAS